MKIAEAPPEILSALREIDPAADLVCVEGGFWLLGVRAPNPAAVEALAGELAGDPHGAHRRRLEDVEKLDGMMAAPKAGARLALLQIYASGFKPIEMYRCDRPGYEIVEDFRLRDWNWKNRPDAAFGEFKDAVSMDVQNAKRSEIIREKIRGDGGFLHHHIMRRAKRFLQRVAFPGAQA